MKKIQVAYLASYALSIIGNSIVAVAFPLLVLQITGSALSAGILAASTAIPAFLAGLFMGTVVDRINRRSASILTDLISALSVAALPLIDIVFGLNLGWFIALGIIGSFGDIPGVTAREALLPAIIKESGGSAERLMGIRESISALAMVVGPAVAGGLILLVDGTAVLWFTAAISLMAALVTLVIPRYVGTLHTAEKQGDGSRFSTSQETRDPSCFSEPTPAPSAANPLKNTWNLLVEGWRVLFTKSPFLLAVTLLDLSFVIVLGGFQGIILPVYFTQIDAAQLLGFSLTTLAAGSLIGGLLYAVLFKSLKRRTWFASGMLGMVVGFGCIALLSHPFVVFLGSFIVGFSSGLFASLLGVLMIESIPDAMRGRIMSTQNSLFALAAPLGIVTASAVIQYGNVFLAAGAGAIIWLVCTIVALSVPAFRTLEFAEADHEQQ
jgi:MFS family permease